MTRAGIAMEARSVTFLTEDSVRVRGTYVEGRNDRGPSLVLVHDIGADRTCWDPYVPLFRSRGWNVLSFDLRGHGESVRQEQRNALLAVDQADLSSPHVYPADARAAVAFASRQPKHQTGRMAMLGLGFGADLAYAGSARGWGGVSTVCVSLNETRARTIAGSGTFAPRTCYLIYGDGDATSVKSAEAFAATAAPPSERFVYPATSAEGLTLWIERQPEIIARAIAWFEKTF